MSTEAIITDITGLLAPVGTFTAQPDQTGAALFAEHLPSNPAFWPVFRWSELPSMNQAMRDEFDCITPIAFENIDIRALWADCQIEGWERQYITRNRFWAALRTLVAPGNDDYVAELDLVKFCDDCDDLGLAEEFWEVNNAYKMVCESCFNDYSTCERCDTLTSSGLNETLDGDVCDSCFSGYRYCNNCEGYFDVRNSSDEHRHPAPVCCESHFPEFNIPNAGSELLPNDVRVTVSLPSGIISPEGLAAISDYIICRLYDQDWSTDDMAKIRLIANAVQMAEFHELGNETVTPKGKFAIRVKRYAYNVHEFRIPAEWVTQIGNIAAAQSAGRTVHLETTRMLNQSAASFYHAGSCWFGGQGDSYARSRCALKTNGGFGIRTYSNPDQGEGIVTGRVWVMPLSEISIDKLVAPFTQIKPDLMLCCEYDEQASRARIALWEESYAEFVAANGAETITVSELVPTHDAESADAYMVFNGYGDLEGFAPAMILSHMFGMTYRRTAFECSPMYINAGGYLIGSAELVKKYSDQTIRFDLDRHADCPEFPTTVDQY